MAESTSCLGKALLSLSVLMSGGSISKVLLIFKHMGLAVYSARTFFRHQTKFLFPVILKHWADSRKALIRQLKNISNASWCGDGRFDSIGHNAKFGVYSMFSSNLSEIVHFELLQVLFLILLALIQGQSHHNSTSQFFWTSIYLFPLSTFPVGGN